MTFILIISPIHVPRHDVRDCIDRSAGHEAMPRIIYRIAAMHAARASATLYMHIQLLLLGTGRL